MRHLLLVLILAVSALGQDADWKVGLNFRGTAGYVTDGSDETYCLGETASTERKTANGNSITFQWSGALSYALDRNAGYDQRIAGVNLQINSTPRTLTITLPQAGTYLVRLAVGDFEYDRGYQYVQILDDGTPKLTVADGGGISHYYFDDATGTEYSYLTWPAGNTAVSVDFATTTFQMVIGLATEADYTSVAHLYLEYVAAPPAGGTPMRRIIPMGD